MAFGLGPLSGPELSLVGEIRQDLLSLVLGGFQPQPKLVFLAEGFVPLTFQTALLRRQP